MFVRDSKFSFPKHKTDIDSLIKVVEANTREASQNPIFFLLIKAKDGPATKSNPDLTKAKY